jgi:hypothetical protein
MPTNIYNGNISNETKILILCSRIDIYEEIKEELKSILEKNIDWHKVLQFAIFHRVVGLLYKNLSQLHFNNKQIINTYQQYYQHSLERNTKIYEKLSIVLNELKQKNIKIILRKGVVLAKLLYKDIGLRPMGDIDILVHPEDWLEIDNILKENGFVSRYDILKIQKLSNNRLFFHILYPYKTKDHIDNMDYSNLIAIEPRLRIDEFDFYKTNIDKIWQNAIDFSCDGIKALMLSYEDMIMELCFNLSKHNFNKLRRSCDINEFILRYKNVINWDVFIKKSYERRLHPLNYLGLKRVKKIFNTPIPENILKQLKPTKSKIIIANKLFPKINSVESLLGYYSSGLPTELRFLLITYQLKSIKMLITILTFFLKVIFPNSKFLSYRYNTTLSTPVRLHFYLRRLKSSLSLLIRFVKILFQS